MTRRQGGLSTLHEAIEWLREAWEARETPTRLHQREHDGWGLMFAPAFARRLDAMPYDQLHDHERPYRRDDCPWRYPTWRALERLRRTNRIAWDVVLTFVINAYSVVAMAALGIGPGGLLGAIRRLFACYERAPEGRRAYIAKSESQIIAEGAVA